MPSWSSTLDRLVFLLDTDAEDVGIPPSRLIDHEFGSRQDAFRRRVQESKLVTQSFASPDALRMLVERSLRDPADTWRRIGSGIRREQVPAGPQPVRASKFVNPPPATAPAWFQDRQVREELRGQPREIGVLIGEQPPHQVRRHLNLGGRHPVHRHNE